MEVCFCSRNFVIKDTLILVEKFFPRLGCLMNVAQNELLMLLKPM